MKMNIVLEVMGILRRRTNRVLAERLVTEIRAFRTFDSQKGKNSELVIKV